jgi:hypothetical protein
MRSTTPHAAPASVIRPSFCHWIIVNAYRQASKEPTMPRGERRPRDDEKDPAAVALGRRGGQARAQGLSKKRRKEIAKRAAQARWSKK